MSREPFSVFRHSVLIGFDCFSVIMHSITKEAFNGLSPPVKYFTDRSKAVLLLWIFCGVFLSCVCYAFVRVCLYVPCDHLLGKGCPLDPRLWCLM